MFWRVFKLLLSAALAALAGLFLYLFATLGFPAFLLGAASALLFFAAWPWVQHDRPNRALSLVIVVFAIMFAISALHVASGGASLPQQCTGRRTLYCEFENALFAVGGNLLAASPFALCSAVAFAIGLGSLRRLRNQSRW